MNLCWIIPDDALPHARDVLPQDDKQLRDDGYQAWRLEWHGEGGREEVTSVYAKTLPKPMAFFAAVNGMYGGSGTLRVFHPDGDPYLP